MSSANLIKPLWNGIVMDATLAFAIFMAYWILVEALKRKGVLEKKRITAYGPVLMIRTDKGLSLLKKVAEKRRLWIALGTAGIPAVFAGMIFMFILIILMDYTLFTSPPPPSEVTSPRNALLIPGINQFIPLIWGLIGLIVTLIVHEFSHAISALSENVKVKSMGVLLALVPIGGFAEPDEEQLLHKSERSTRLRVFSSGVISNFITALIAFSVFFYLLGFISPSIAILKSENPQLKTGDIVVKINGMEVRSPEDISKAVKDSEIIVLTLKNNEEVKLSGITGVRILQVVKDYPAFQAGIQSGWIITAVDGKKIYTLNDFLKAMENRKAGETVRIQVYDGKSFRDYELTLKDSNGKAIIGVQVEEYFAGVSFSYYYASNILHTLKSIPSMLTNPAGWLFLISMPIIFFNSFSSPLIYFFTSPFGDWIFYALNAFYWIGWINFYVGLFNCLPAIPLDGGRVFYDVVEKIGGKRFADMATRTFSTVIFASIILSIVIPNLPR